MSRTRHTVFGVIAGLGLIAGVSGLAAQTVSGGAQGADLLAAGENALAKGDFQAATGHFGKALRSNDLNDTDVARALYQRGVAYERAGRPAQAIADITNALFIPGLLAADRAKAYLARGRAYEAVGMDDLARADIASAKSGGVSEQQIARSSAPPQSPTGDDHTPSFATSVQRAGERPSVPSFATSARPGDTPAEAPSFSTRSNTPSAAASGQQVAAFETQSRSTAPVRKEPSAQFRTTIVPQESEAQPRRTDTPVATRAPASHAPSAWSTSSAAEQAPPAAQEQVSESGGTVSRFFSGLWSNTTGKDEKKQKTADGPAPAPPTPAATPPAPAVPRWSQTTNTARAPQPSWSAQVSSPGQTQPSAPAARPPVTPQPAVSPESGRGYKIQLAALRSDAEARQTWQRLQSKHGSLLGEHQPNIVKTDLGGLGTFYRLQLGPFSDKAASQELCNNFKRGGLDCFLLTQ